MKLLSAYKNVQSVLLLFLGIVLQNTVNGQTIIAVQDFETTPATPTLAITTGTPTYFTGSSATGDRPASTPFYFGGARAWGETNITKTLTFADQSLSGYTGCYVEYKLSSFSIASTGNGADGADIVTTEISIDGGATYFSTVRVLGNANAYWAYSATGNATTTYDGNATPVDFAPAGGGNRTTDGYSTVRVDLPGSATQVRVRITILNNATGERWCIDDLKILGNVATSTLTVSPSTLSGFSYILGSGPSVSQSYDVSGVLLTGAPGTITVTESADYEVSSDNITFGVTASIPYSSATLSPTPVYVRLKAGRASGLYNGQTISNSGGGASSVNVTCNGNIPAPLLTVSPTSLSGFIYVLGGGPSPSQSYNLSGSNLSGAPGNITVTESTDYEVSADNITFGSTANIPYAFATLSSTPVYVRLKAGRAVAAYNGQTISNAGGSASAVSVTCSGNVVANSVSSDIISFGGESATISSIINDITPLTASTGVQVWQFKVRDGGAGLSDADAFPTILTDFTISQAAGNSVSNWSTAIRTIELFDGATNVGIGTVTTSPNQISFSGLSLSVTDNTEKTFSLRLSMNCGIGSTNFEGDDFGFQISNGNVTFSAAGSGKASFSAASTTNGTNVIAIAATQLSFFVQPVTTGVGQTMSPSVVIKATDACGNTDLSYTGTITVTSTGTLTGTPVTSTAVAGTATFGSLIHTVIGTGFTLSASAGGLMGAVSTAFDITVATVLGVGDIAIVGMCVNMNGCSGSTTTSEDEISFVSFEDISPGTSIDITDNGFERLNCGSNTWGNTEGVIRITRTTSTITKGTIITLRILDQTIFFPVQPDANWTVSYPNSGHGTFNMNSSDEQIYILQGGTWNKNTFGAHNATYTGGTLMFGINTYTNWTCNSNSSNRGDLPLSLKCFSILPGIATSHIKYTGPTTPAAQKDWIDRLNTSGNWSGYTTCASYLSGGLDYESPQTFVISSGGFASGQWTGASTTDWFDCNNWQNYKVPDSLVNVTIDNVTNDPVIGASPVLYPNGATCNDLLISATSGAGVLTINNALSRISIKGNVTNNGVISSTNGLSDFRSANAQTISGTGSTDFYNLRINNSNAAGLSLLKPINVSGTVTFYNGLLTSSSTNLLNMSAGSSSTGANNFSFVNGPVRKTGTTDFIFPTGKDAQYRPIAVSSLSSSEIFTAEYFHADPDAVPYDVTAKDATLEDIGRCEYWMLDRSGSATATVALSWNTYSCGVTSLSDLAVARWDGTMWKDEGNTATTGFPDPGTGTVSSGTITSFSPFTLATRSALENPLPVELLSFTAKYNSSGKVNLNWSTASETNNDYFTIERSADGINFVKIGVTDGAGNSHAVLHYSMNDDSPLTGLSYYRLKQTDFDGTEKYSSIVQVERTDSNFQITNAYFESSQETLSVMFNCQGNCEILIELYDINGKAVCSFSRTQIERSSSVLIPASSLSGGIYLIKANNGKNFVTRKILITRP